MRRRFLHLIVLLAAACARAASGAAADPFADASLAPANIDMFLHVENAGRIRAAIAERPIAAWLDGVLAGKAMQAAWKEVARACQLSESELFDRVFGASCTLITRQGGEWALLTQIEERRATELLSRLKVRILPPRQGLAICELPEQEMIIGRDGGRLLIGASRNAGLFNDVLARMVGRAAAGSSLGGQAFMELSRELGPGTAAVVIRHEEPLGGQSLAVADLSDLAERGTIAIRNASQFENPLFDHPVTKLSCDFSPVAGFRSRALVAMGEPMDVGDGPLEAYLSASLRQSLMSQAMRDNLKDRRLLVVGEHDFRDAQGRSEYFSPTLVACMEVKDRERARAQLDEQMVRLTRAMSDLNEGALLEPLKTPDLQRMLPGEPREVDLNPLFAGGFPVMKSVSLAWTVAESPTACWFVVGTERQSLDETVKTLCGPPAANEAFSGKFDNCGVCNGPRISRHLLSWGDQAQKLAEPGKADELKSTLRAMADLAAGLQECEWQLARPTAQSMRLNVQIRLSPSGSAPQQ